MCWFVPDVIGVVKLCNDISTVIGKQSQKEITKRDLQIVDQSAVAINLTLWGNDVSTHLHTRRNMVVGDGGGGEDDDTKIFAWQGFIEKYLTS